LPRREHFGICYTQKVLTRISEISKVKSFIIPGLGCE
jgi:hypothetical protein